MLYYYDLKADCLYFQFLLLSICLNLQALLCYKRKKNQYKPSAYSLAQNKSYKNWEICKEIVSFLIGLGDNGCLGVSRQVQGPVRAISLMSASYIFKKNGLKVDIGKCEWIIIYTAKRWLVSPMQKHTPLCPSFLSVYLGNTTRLSSYGTWRLATSSLFNPKDSSCRLRRLIQPVWRRLSYWSTVVHTQTIFSCKT